MKDTSIFKSSAMFSLASPTIQSLPNDSFQNNNHFFNNKPPSRGDSNSRQQQYPQQLQQYQIQQVQQALYDNLPNLSYSKQQQNGYSSLNGSRKQSLLSKNMNSEQLKDWLIGKQTNSPLFPQIDKNKTQLTPNSTNRSQIINLSSRQNDPYGLLQNRKLDDAQTEEMLPRQANHKVQRRSKSQIILTNIPEIEQTSKYIINPKSDQTQNSLLGSYLIDQKYQKISNEDDTDTSTSQMSRVNARKRQKNPSFNPTTISLFDMQKSEIIKLQQNKQNPSVEQQQIDKNQETQNDVSEQKLQISKSAIFASPNKFNKSAFGFTDNSPLRPPSGKKDTTTISLNRTQQNSLVNMVNGPQPQTNLTQRQIYLKNLQVNTELSNFLDLPSKQTSTPITISGQQNNNIVNNQINKQFPRKMNSSISPLSAPSQPLIDEILTTTASSSQSSSILPFRSNRQSKTFTHIDNISKNQIIPTNQMQNTKYRAWGSYSSLDEQYQNQPKGILKQRKDNSKLKKSVVFDKKLQVHELNENKQA